MDETRQHLEYVGLSDPRQVSLGKILADPVRWLNKDGCLYVSRKSLRRWVAKQNVRDYPGGEGEIRTLGRAFDPTTV